MTENRSSDMGFLLERLCGTSGVVHAIAVTSDGLLRAKTSGLPTDTADTLAAVTSGFTSLAGQASKVLDSGAVTRNLVETEDGYLIISAVNERWLLAVVAAANCNLGQVGFEMDATAVALKAALDPAPLRQPQRA